MALTLFGLGLIGAFASGLVGVGGAIVMIPLLLYVPPLLSVGAFDIKIVAGLTMTQVLAAAVVGAWSHGRHALVHRALAWTGGPAMAAGSLVGAVASRLRERSRPAHRLRADGDPRPATDVRDPGGTGRRAR